MANRLTECTAATFVDTASGETMEVTRRRAMSA